jgi:Lanthionine synthetase C-like protein
MHADQALELAREAERFIDSLRLDGLDSSDSLSDSLSDSELLESSSVEAGAFREVGSLGGVASIRPWRRVGQSKRGNDHTVYHGSAGIGLFELELALATGDQSYARKAEDAAELVAATVRSLTNAPVAFATGWPGYAFALDQFSRSVGSAEQKSQWRAAAALAVEKLEAQSSVAGGGIAWVEPMPFSDITGFTGDREIYDLSVGAAGAVVTLLDLLETNISDRSLPLALSAAERLLEVAVKTDDGWRWDLMNDIPFPFLAPNFAHGGAGVGYVLAQLFDRTGDERFLDAAIEAARYTMSRASDVGDGCLVCHTEQQQPPHFYLGACHGPAGTGRLLLTLERLTGDPQWREQLQGLYRGLMAIGAPATRSWGWWQNHGQCCGDAGLGDFALLAWEATGDQQWLDLAHACAEVLLSVSSSGPVGSEGLLDAGGPQLRVASSPTRTSFPTGKPDRGLLGRWWVQAEHRARPEFLQAQTGYMQGAAGIASFFVHLATASSPNPIRVRFPDQRL